MKRALTLILLLIVLPSAFPAGEEEAFPTPGGDPESTLDRDEGPVTCWWKFHFPARDFKPGEGDAYRISVSGSDRSRLILAYTRLRPYAGDARIAVHTRKTPENTILLDQQNQGLFSAQTGEFDISLSVPGGWPLYLVEYPDNPYADPVVLSNIVELP